MEDTDSDSDESEYWIIQRPEVQDTPASVIDVTEGPDPEDESTPSVGDAQPVMEDRDDMVEGSASDDESVQQEEPPVEADEAALVEATPPEVERPPVQPRRSTRVRTEPKWLKSGEYLTKSTVPSAEWKDKVNYFTEMFNKGLFSGIESEAGRTFLSILKDNT